MLIRTGIAYLGTGYTHPNSPAQIKQSAELIYYLKYIREINLMLVNTMEMKLDDLNELT
jgi:hypothetical protein